MIDLNSFQITDSFYDRCSDTLFFVQRMNLYEYITPIYMRKKKPLIFMKLQYLLPDETGNYATLRINVVDSKGAPYFHWYTYDYPEYCKDMCEKLDKQIIKELRKLGIIKKENKI